MVHPLHRHPSLTTTPWRHDSELAMLRDWFYPAHAVADVYADGPTMAMGLAERKDVRQRATEKVNAYLFKRGKIPHALVATQALMEGKLLDEAWAQGTTTGLLEEVVGENMVKSVFCMGWIRFVNGFVDRDVARSRAEELLIEEGKEDDAEAMEGQREREKVKGGGESSMYAHAARIGMPETFVDLRHEVSHGEMPSLRYLRKMNELGLEWLWDKWWKKSAKGDAARALREERERISAFQGESQRKETESKRKDQQAEIVEPDENGIAGGHSTSSSKRTATSIEMHEDLESGIQDTYIEQDGWPPRKKQAT